MVLVCCAQQLTELLKQLVHFICFDTDARVYNVHLEQTLSAIESTYNPNRPLPRELKGVFDQVDQDLLEPKLVSA